MAILIKNRTARRSPRQQRRERSPLSTAGLWLMIGMLIGIITASGAYLLITGKWSIMPSQFILEPKSEGDVLEAKDLNHKPRQAGKTKETPKTDLVQRFEFYQLLPGMEVPIPDTPTKVPPVAHTLIESPPAPTPVIDSENEIKPLTPKILPNTEAKELKKASKISVKKTIPKQNVKESKKPNTQKKVAAAQYLIQAGAFREQQKAENLKARLATKGFTTRIQKIDAEDGIWFRVILGPFSTESTALNQKILLTKHKIQGILLLQRR